MSAVTEILRCYRAPDEVLRRRLDDGPTEARVLAWLMVAVLLIFVGQLPALVREAHLTGGDPPFEALASGAALGVLLIAPLLFYALAAVSFLVVRLVARAGTGLGARVALFWALLATAPLMLIRGLVAGFAGPGAAYSILGGMAAAAFLTFWIIGMREMSRKESDA